MNELIEKNFTELFSNLSEDIKSARLFPRDIKKSLEEAKELVRSSEEISDSCIFSLQRKKYENNKQKIFYITGPSVRLAEIVAHTFGNIETKARISQNDGFQITAEACCRDLEKGVIYFSEVKKNIKGGSYSDEMKAILENASMSKAIRNCIFKVIPRAYINNIYEECLNSLNEKNKYLRKLFERFEQLGIKTETIINFYEKSSINDFSRNEIAQLIGIGNAIKDGSLEAHEAFISSKESKTNSVLKQLEKLEEIKNEHNNLKILNVLDNKQTEQLEVL